MFSFIVRDGLIYLPSLVAVRVMKGRPNPRIYIVPCAQSRALYLCAQIKYGTQREWIARM